MDLILGILSWVGMMMLWGIIILIGAYGLYLIFELVDKIVDKYEDDL